MILICSETNKYWVNDVQFCSSVCYEFLALPSHPILLYGRDKLGLYQIRKSPRSRLNIKMLSFQYRNSMLRRSCGRPIFNMGITILGKDSLYIETGPRFLNCLAKCWREDCVTVWYTYVAMVCGVFVIRVSGWQLHAVAPITNMV